MSAISQREGDWTIQSRLSHRQTIRQKWDQQFNENYLEVAKKISKVILDEIFQKLSNRFDPSQTLPTSMYALHFKYDEDRLLELAKEMAPFNEEKKGEDLDTFYFQNATSKLGEEIKKEVKQGLFEFSQKRGNKKLRFVAEWDRKPETYCWQSTPEGDRTLHISVWIQIKFNAFVPIWTMPRYH